MGEVAIPVQTNLHIESESGGSINIADSFVRNGIIDSYAGNKPYVTQRPGISTTNLPSEGSVTDARGRSVYYWETVGALYFINDDVVYKDSYSAAVTENTGTFDSGTEKVWFFELSDKLIIIDAENNKGYTIDDGASTTMDVIADLDFPPNQTPALQLCTGGAVLNGRLYVMSTDGKIWGSDLNDPTAWTATTVLTAEKDSDQGVHLSKHHDNLVAFGTRTIEFFYDAANAAPGSPLSPREDISYNLGCAEGNTVHRENDDIFFVGIANSGGIGVWMIKDFGVSQISTDTLASMLGNTLQVDGFNIVGSGYSTGGRAYYLLTSYTLLGSPTVVSPDETYVFNSKTNTWTLWEHADPSISKMPIISWTLSTGSVTGKGILSNGDIIEFLDNFIPKDADAIDLYVVDDYVAADYVEGGSGAANNITMTIRIAHLDENTRENKFMHKLRYVGDSTTNSQDLLIKWADSNHDSFSMGRTIDIQNDTDKLTRLGKYKSRAFELEYSGDEQIRIQGLIAEIRKGTT